MYIPLLTAHQMKTTGAGYQSGNDSSVEASEEERGKRPVKVSQLSGRDEMLNSAYKFLEEVKTALQQVANGLFCEP